MFFCIGIKVMVVKDLEAFLPTSEPVSWERNKIPLRNNCIYFFYVLLPFFFSLLYLLWRSLSILPQQSRHISVNEVCEVSKTFNEFLGRSINSGSNIDANKLYVYFFKLQSEYKDFAVNCKISQSCLACHCCTFSLPHDIFLTKSIIYMGFKFNLNVMNLNWALLYFKVAGLLFCKLIFSMRDSTSGFWLQLLSLTLKFPPPSPPSPSPRPYHLSTANPSTQPLTDLWPRKGAWAGEKGQHSHKLHVLGVWGLLIGASNRRELQGNQIDIFLGGIMRFFLHMSVYLSNHSLPRSESS